MAGYKAGFTEGQFFDDRRKDWNGLSARPVSWSCWYPVDIEIETAELRFGGSADAPWFTQGQVAMNATISNSQNEWPAVLLSHGTGGTADGLAWLGTRLARAGFICIAVNHHGNTAVELYRAEGFICWWERAADLSFICDQTSSIPEIESRIDFDQISVAGFSLGGYTSIALAGAVTSMQLFENWLIANPNPIGGPREYPDLDKKIPELMSSSHRFRQSWDRQSESYLDARISKCVAIAPAPPVRAFTQKSLSQIKIPTLIVAGEADQEAPFGQCSEWLKQHNPSFRLHTAGKNVGHYTFLAECTEQGRCLEPEICNDHSSINRSNIHDNVSILIGDFLASDSVT